MIFCVPAFTPETTPNVGINMPYMECLDAVSVLAISLLELLGSIPFYRV